VKYAEENTYLEYFDKEFINTSFDSSAAAQDDWFACVDCDPDGENRILAALIYRYSNRPFAECLIRIQNLADPEKERLAADLLGRLGEHDIPLRELEYASITFDILMDQGAYFEFKRHRMMTQTPQMLSTFYDFAVPKLLSESGEGDLFIEDMQKADDLYQRLSEDFPQAASYIVPNAFNRRVLVKMNLRSALHFINLRSAPNAHYAIRRVALRISKEINGRFPLLARFNKLDRQETPESIWSGYFSNTV
jgi:thymidylate synthase ThyX